MVKIINQQDMNNQKLAMLLKVVESLKPFEVIEIKLEDNKQGKISVIRKTTWKETFDL